MRDIWTIAQREYIVNARRAGFLFFTALVPLLGLLGLAVMAFTNLNGGAFDALESAAPAEQTQPVGVVDQAGFVQPMLAEYAERFQLYPDEEAGREALRNEEVDAVLVIPANYLEQGQVRVINTDNSLDALAALSSDTARAFLVDHLVRDQLDPTLRQRLADPYDMERVTLEGAEADPLGTVTVFVLPFLFGILLGISIFTASGYMLQGVAQEKSSRVVEILLSSVTSRQLMAGKLLGLGALGLTQILVWVTSTALLGLAATRLLDFPAAPFDLLRTRPEVAALALLYYLLGYTLYAVLIGAVGALGTSQQESQQMGGLFTFVAVIPFMLSGLIVGNPNILLVRILSWFPLTAPTTMLLRIPITDAIPPIDIVGSLALLVLSIPLALWAGGKIFRLGLLIYGQRPSLRRILHALAQA